MRHGWFFLLAVAALAGCFGADDDEDGEGTRTVTVTRNVTPGPTPTASVAPDPSPTPTERAPVWTETTWSDTLEGFALAASEPEAQQTFVVPAGAVDLYVNFSAEGSPLEARVRMPTCDDAVCEATLEPGDSFHATESLAGNWTVTVEPAQLGAVDAEFRVVLAVAAPPGAGVGTTAGPTGTPSPTPSPTPSASPTPYP